LIAVARLQRRLLADDAGPAHLLDLSVAIGDVPVSGEQLDEFPRIVDDGDTVAPDIAALRRVGAVREVERLDRDFDVARDGAVHDASPQVRAECRRAGGDGQRARRCGLRTY